MTMCVPEGPEGGKVPRIERVLVTGVAGYIGSVLAQLLLERGCQVYGVDSLLFGDEGIKASRAHPKFSFIRADIRDADSYAGFLREVEAVVHLAAIVGDPACSKSPELARETNVHGSTTLFEAAHESPMVQRFIAVSTCSNYGMMKGEEYCSEESRLEPLSLYAETKVEFERHVLQSRTRDGFVPTVLRFATAYGLSPRMRYDLTVNEFTRDVAMGNELVIYGEHFWRPYCHTQDLARACLAVLEADPSVVDHEVFNVGATVENYTKQNLANLLLEFDPEATIRYVPKLVDRRDYKVAFEKIRSTLSFTNSKTVREGIREVFDALKTGLCAAPYSDTFRNC